MHMRGSACAAVLAACGVVASAGAGAPSYTAKVITPLDGFGFVTGTDVSNAGIVAGYSSPTLDEYPILGVKGIGDFQADQLPTPGDEPVFVWGVNDTSTLYTGSSGFRPAAWVVSTPILLEQSIEEVGLFGAFGAALDSNDFGVIVGELDTDIPHYVQAVYWEDTEAGPKLLPGLNPPFSAGSASGINNIGQVVGTSVDATGSHFAVRWDSVAGDPLNLGTLEGYTYSNGLAINSSGDVAGFAQDPGTGSIEGFLWNAATDEMVGIGHLPGAALPFSEAHGVNFFKDVVGAANAGPGIGHAILWRNGELFDLNDLVAPIDGVLYLAEARAINDQGQIVAAGVTAEGPGFQDRVIVLLTPDPKIPVECPGDTDGNLHVDSVDLNNLLANFGCVSSAPKVCIYDQNADGKIDSQDLNVLLGAFGDVCG